MKTPITTKRPYLVLRDPDYAHLGERDFGMPGLQAAESIGPFVEIQASGPLITVHDAIVKARLGIGHHPHRSNERLFYILEGQLDHDDALNGISGHMDTGDVGRFTEGRRGMLHSEWNHGDTDTHAYILVYSTHPVPEQAAFGRLRDAEAPRYEEVPGIRTKELVGPRSPLMVHGDIRFFAESHLDPEIRLPLRFGAQEGGLVSIREGTVTVEGSDDRVAEGATLLIPVDEDPRTITLHAAGPARLIRVVHGPGHGFVRQTPQARR